MRQSEEVEQTLWVAVRMMEERKLLLEKMARENSEKGLGKLSADYKKHSRDMEEHIVRLKQILFENVKD